MKIKNPFAAKFEVGDFVRIITHASHFEITKRWWWFGWRYDMQTNVHKDSTWAMGFYKRAVPEWHLAKLP